MFAQVNSEHCRHKQFNAEWTIDGEKKPNSLFGMIRNTHKANPKHTISAYSDNAAVLEGNDGVFWAPKFETGEWEATKEPVYIVTKVETHNHPTAVSPFPGAATGSGGEIRDEGAVGRGSKPKAGLSGYSVSDLLIPGQKQPWELDVGKPNHIASSLDIMLEAPIGSAAFNNEFGRPCTLGYFRTLTTTVPLPEGGEEIRGYHKPIMIAGGLGTVRPQHALKDEKLVNPGAYIIVLGGPAMLIGLGGGAASSISSGEGSVDLDFASVQRGNPEQQRRAQMVIDACVALGEKNPIGFIHDVGAGGLSNALPELVHDAGLGATFELREIDNASKGMSPLEIWCCEAQERYVMAVSEEGLKTFEDIAQRERCGFSIVGRAEGSKTDESQNRLVLTDRDSMTNPKVIDLPMTTLFGKPPKMKRSVESRKLPLPPFDHSLKTYLSGKQASEVLKETVHRVLHLPAVGSKSFLITIGDRTVTGLITRDQMVGPWQVPVADVAVTATSLMEGVKTGEGMAMGERPSLALISAAASAKMAVAESLMNLAAADIQGGLERVRLSANWMAPANHPGEGAALYEAVEAIGMDLCPKLGVSIPVGKDSMSMKMKWSEDGKSKEVTAPVSLVITAFCAVEDHWKTWTPQIKREADESSKLIFVDLAEDHMALGGSAVAQVYNQVGDEAPTVRNVDIFKAFFKACAAARKEDLVEAYHDRSDGGLFTTIIEMAFAGRVGVKVDLSSYAKSSSISDIIPALFNEELGAVFNVNSSNLSRFTKILTSSGIPSSAIHTIGHALPISSGQSITFNYGTQALYASNRATLQQAWTATSYALQRLRDNPACADSEYASILEDSDPGLTYHLPVAPVPALPANLLTSRPAVAILREQGVNSHAEMAFAFKLAGFTPVDVHMTDLISGRVSLSSFTGLAACGGFSYGDVLGAGRGWAASVLLHANTREEFKKFFERKDTFALGVCNGCQFFSQLTDIIPGTSNWPRFLRNESEQYEGRVAQLIVEPEASKSSVFFNGLAGARIPIAVAHGEGRAVFANQKARESCGIPLRYVDGNGKRATEYPKNPNGSEDSAAGVINEDGRVLAMMPHPERTVVGGTGSWVDKSKAGLWGESEGPWVALFKSTRRWVN